MYTVIYIWKDGTMDMKEVKTKKEAVAMAKQLYTNDLITNVIISDAC